jgi:hypothetical protein
MRYIALFLGVGLSGCFGGPPADYQTLRESRPIGTAKAMDVQLNFGVGNVEVRSDSGENLFSFDLDYDATRSTPRFDFQQNGDRAQMMLSTEQRFGIRGSRRINELTLLLNDSVPLDLDLTTGVSDADLDMTNLQIQTFHLRGGVGRTDVTFDRPSAIPMSSLEVESGVGNLTIRKLGNARVGQVRVNGGVGQTDLDFTGDLVAGQINSEINIGVGHVRLLLPREAEITIEADQSFLSKIDAPGFSREDRTYTHRGFEPGESKIYIRIRSGVGGVRAELL